ncbi:nucleoside deaminase [Alphaproteobacteria bacterium LSUCC0684]
MTGSQYQNNAMATALDLARQAALSGEVPVAAVITATDGAILAAEANRVERDKDPTAHAEILAIRAAAHALGSTRLAECDLWVTLEPCPMCAGAIAQARLRRLYYGADDPKSGGVAHGPRVFSHPTCHHEPEIYGGIKAEDSARLLREFFRARR